MANPVEVNVPNANQLLEHAARTAGHHDPWVLLLAGALMVVTGVANQVPGADDTAGADALRHDARHRSGGEVGD